MTYLPTPGEEFYLGDGLYVSFDGYGIRLRAPRFDSDHFVALEPEVFKSLINWLAAYPELRLRLGLK